MIEYSSPIYYFLIYNVSVRRLSSWADHSTPGKDNAMDARIDQPAHIQRTTRRPLWLSILAGPCLMRASACSASPASGSTNIPSRVSPCVSLLWFDVSQQEAYTRLLDILCHVTKDAIFLH